MTSALTRSRRGEDTGREGKAIWSERQRTGVMWPQPRETEVLAAPRRRRRQEGVSPGVRSGSAALQTLHFQTTGLRNYERILSILLSHELIGAGCGRPWTQHTLSPSGVSGAEQGEEPVPQRLQVLWGEGHLQRGRSLGHQLLSSGRLLRGGVSPGEASSLWQQQGCTRQPRGASGQHATAPPPQTGWQNCLHKSRNSYTADEWKQSEKDICQRERRLLQHV